MCIVSTVTDCLPFILSHKLALHALHHGACDEFIQRGQPCYGFPPHTPDHMLLLWKGRVRVLVMTSHMHIMLP
jgi:hypothetical protein